MFIDFIKRYKVAVFIIFLFFWMGAAGFAVVVFSIGKAELAPPVQPINFSHKIHVSEQEIDCTTCHEFVDKSPVAGAPPLETCMTCHEAVAMDRPQIVKLRKYRDEKKPVEWARVYSLPDAIYFTHKRHVKAGLECSTCHGDVGSMERMRRVRRLNMGWCVDCHKKKDAPRECVTCHK